MKNVAPQVVLAIPKSVQQSHVAYDYVLETLAIEYIKQSYKSVRGKQPDQTKMAPDEHFHGHRVSCWTTLRKKSHLTFLSNSQRNLDTHVTLSVYVCVFVFTDSFLTRSSLCVLFPFRKVFLLISISK